MYLVSLRAARCLRSGHHYQLTTIILKCFPLDEQKCPGTAYGRLGNLTMYLIREFEVRLISQTGLTVQSMQVSVYISYFENIMNAGWLFYCWEYVKISQEWSLQRPTGARRTQRRLATFSWRQTRPAAQCWQTSWGREDSPCSWWTPCKTAL